MYDLRWSLRSGQDFKRLRSFLSNKSSQASLKIKPIVQESCEVLRSHPELGTSLDDTLGRRTWRIPFGKGDYIVYYIPDHERKIIQILRIYHSREDR